MYLLDTDHISLVDRSEGRSIRLRLGAVPPDEVFASVISYEEQRNLSDFGKVPDLRIEDWSA